MYTVYGMTESGNCYKLKLLLAQCKLEYKWHEIDIFKGESRTPEFLAMNPNGEVPVMRLPDGKYLAQSNAILYYLAQGTSYWFEDNYLAAQALQWMFFEQYTHEPSIAVARAIRKFYPADSERKQELPALSKKGYQALIVMERHLEDNQFFVADRYSIADIALYAYTHMAEEGGFDLSPYTQVNRWLQAVREQAGHVPIR